MAQEVKIAGALFENVPKIQVPDSNDVYHPFVDPSVTTATASDVAIGKVFISADGTQTTGTASGGGSSNIVTGTFIGTASDAALSVPLSYTGSGYPVMTIIAPVEGAYCSSGALYQLIQRYAVVYWAGCKSVFSSTPTFTGSTDDRMTVLCLYKSSSSNATQYTDARNMSPLVYNTSNATASYSLCVKFNSPTQMSVYIAGSSYGFAAGYEYKYAVIYSE